MSYLIWNIWLCLLLAFLLGLLFGWLICRRVNRQKIVYLENIWKANLYSREEELQETRNELELLRNRLSSRTETVSPEAPTVAPEAGPAQPVTPLKEEESSDDLKLIYGIGPFIEKRLNALGIHTFRQIAALTPDRIQSVREKIGPFKDRIERDGWVRHAHILYREKYGRELE